uniref:Peptidase M13 N-terminal domain-containing protein n=1 Tax=Acrobeloides nanus TaxID=290746 RepID=A0A914DJC4_9BILA
MISWRTSFLVIPTICIFAISGRNTTKNTISLQSVLDQINGSYQIRAHNVTMFIPDLVISRSGIEISDASVKADAMEVIQDSNSSQFMPAYTIVSNETRTGKYLLHDYPELTSSINPKLDPCENFYNFVCKGWEQHHEIKEDETSVNQFTVINDKIENQIGSILKNRTKYDTNRLTTLLYDMYESCMNNVSRDEAGSGIILDILSKIKQSKNLTLLTDWLIEVYPVSLFYTISVVPDIRDPKRNMISLQPTSLYLGSEKYYIEQRFEHSMEALKVYLRKVLKFFIEDDVGKKFFANSTAEIERRIESFVKVETAVAEIQNNTDKHYDNVYAGDKIVTVHELQNNISKTINWSRYFAHIFPEEVLAAVGDLSKMEVHVSIIEAIEKLEALSRNLPGQVFADFLQWRIILNYVGFLDDRFIDARFVRLISDPES